MTDKISERIERAHTIAFLELIYYLEKFQVVNPDIQMARIKYCESFQNEVFYNPDGIKEYDDELITAIMPAVIREFQSDRLDVQVLKAIKQYNQKIMKMKILEVTAKTILSSRFPQETIDSFIICAYSENEIQITQLNSLTSNYTRMNLETLMSRVKEAEKMEDLF